MQKMLAKAWEMAETESNASDFFDDPKSSTKYVLCLSSIGQKIDSDMYRLGRHGWEDFARDLGGVYNRHIKRYEVVLLTNCRLVMSDSHS